jgi:hypothetical protein
MADDNSFRSYRSSDPYRRAEPAREPAGSDPLAELARLIGQHDPRFDFPRSSPQAQPAAPRPSAPQWPPATAAHAVPSRGPASREPYPSAEQDESPLAVIAARAEARRAETQRPPQPAPRYQPAEPLTTFADDRLHAPEPQPQDDEPPYYQAAGEADEAPLDPYQEQVYDDSPRARSRGGLTTAIALVACALVGTAGAYAYRSYSTPTGAKDAPRVITADSSPTKVAVAPPADPQSSKQISERFANAANPDNLISRQEEPVSLREPTAPSAPPRVVLPAPMQPASPAPAQPIANAPPANTGPAANAAPDAPKRVRTVTIRPDGTDPSGRPVAIAPAAAPASANARAAVPQRPAAPTQNGNAPLSLNPQGGPVDNAPRPRVADRGPVGTVSTGSYVVQLSSQKTEAEAQASFRALQAKFPSELGDRQLIIRRADLGAKGVVYRANVGPFATASEAQQFCANYKAAGGQCLVPPN